MPDFLAASIVIIFITVVAYFVLRFVVFDGEDLSTIIKTFLPSGETAVTPVIVLEDDDFGVIRYDEASVDGGYGYWQMDSNWADKTYSSACIPGTVDGPSKNARKFILEKFGSEDELWDFLSDDLRYVAESFIPEDKDTDIKEIFFLSCINTDPITDTGDQEWEVCFQSREDYKWLYIGLQIKNGDVLSNTIDT